MRNFIQCLLIIILSISFIHQCESKKKMKKTSKHNESVLLDSVQYYKNSLGQEVAEKKSFQGTAQELEQILDAKRKENAQLNEAMKHWKSIANATQIKTVTEIKEVAIPFEVPIPCEFSRTFVKHDKWFSIGGEVTQAQIFIENILIPNDQTIVAGRKKLGWLKTEVRAEVINSNPNIKTYTIDNFTFVDKKQIYEKWYITIPVGIIAGFLIK